MSKQNLNTNINKISLENLISKGYSIRDLAKYFNVQIGTIQYYLRKYQLKTIYSKYKGKPKRNKINMKITNDYDNALWIDITNFTIPSGKRKAKDIGIKGLTVIYKNHYMIFLFEYYDKTIITQIILRLIKRFKPSKVLADKEFYYLNDIIPTYKVANWNCSKQLNEKFHGLKCKIYANIRFLKDILRLTNRDLLTVNRVLVLAEYVKILKRHNWEIVNYIGKLHKRMSVKEIKAIIHP